MYSKHRFLLVPLILLFSFLCIFIWKPFAKKANSNCIHIGLAAPLSGLSAHLGSDCRDGALLAVEEINKQQEEQGKEQRLCLVVYDDQDNVRQAIVAAYRFVDQNVQAVLAHLSSGLTIAASPLYYRAGIPQLSPSSHMSYTNQNYNTTFRIMANDDQQSLAIARFMSNTLGSKRIAIVHNGTVYGEELANRVALFLSQGGATIVAREFMRTTETDFHATLAKIMRQTPDAIFYAGIDAQVSLLARQMKETNVMLPLVSGDMACTEKFIELAGELASDNMYCSTNGRYVTDTVEGQLFIERYRRRFNKEPILYSVYYYDAIQMIASVLLDKNSLIPLIDRLPTIEFQGVAGQLRYDTVGNLRDTEVGIYSPTNVGLELKDFLSVSSVPLQ